MNILVVGNGGREHALVWKIMQSPRIRRVYCAPGNGGIAGVTECVDIDVTNLKGLVNFAKKKKIDLTVVGPEVPLTMGVVDLFTEKGLPIFGPTERAAELEGSKAFSKDFMAKYNIPTAGYQLFSDPEKAIRAIHALEPPLVLKADGLAAGKGVLICHSRSEAYDAVDLIMKNKTFGEAGNRVVIEDYLEGEEASVLAISDGDHFVVLPSSQDHKAIFEGDKGPNTGGMGAYAPVPVMDNRILETVQKKILQPTIDGMKTEGRMFKGVLYAGLMITSHGPKVLEFNCRFGDPETQAVLPLLESDLVDLMTASIDGTLPKEKIKIKSQSAVCVVMTSGGYPGSYPKGMEIKGLDKTDQDILIFHAGTKQKGKKLVTSGGRVLGITVLGDNIQTAVDKVYKAVGKVAFDGAYYRRDIAYRALKR